MQSNVMHERAPGAKGERDQAIRAAAYFKWEQAGRPEGDGADFWLEAEREYLAQHENEAFHDGAMIVRPKALPKPGRA
jgi:hypothetical protein